MAWLPAIGAGVGSSEKRGVALLGRYRIGKSEVGLREDSPSIEQGLARGQRVSVVVRSGLDVSGYVCDRDGNGLLLDLRDPSGDPDGYEFLPWSSVERVALRYP